MNYKPSAKMLDLIMPLSREWDMSPIRVMELLLLEGYKSRGLVKEDIDWHNNNPYTPPLSK